MKNFDITGVPISHYPPLIRALAMVKKAAALTNYELGYLDLNKKDAIVQACDEIIVDECLLDEFPVDLIQGGAGTSTNMNINEVIANRGLEIMGHEKGVRVARNMIDWCIDASIPYLTLFAFSTENYMTGDTP